MRRGLPPSRRLARRWLADHFLAPRNDYRRVPPATTAAAYLEQVVEERILDDVGLLVHGRGVLRNDGGVLGDGVVGVVAPALDFGVGERFGTAGPVRRPATGIGAFITHLCHVGVRLASTVGFGADLRPWRTLRFFVRPPPMFAQDSVDHLIQTGVFVIDAFARLFIAEPVTGTAWIGESTPGSAVSEHQACNEHADARCDTQSRHPHLVLISDEIVAD